MGFDLSFLASFSIAALQGAAEQLFTVGQQLIGSAGVERFSAQLTGGTDDLRGAVGNIVTAYLQTKGMIDQATILSKFREAMEMIAALFWLAATAMAIGSVAIFGNYRQGLYLLIGPALFYFMIDDSASTTGTQLRVGNFVQDKSEQEQSEMLNYIRAIDPDNPNAAVKISPFFAMWDAVVSEGMQSVIALLMNTDERDHLRFVARERMLNHVLQSSADHSGMTRLVGAVFTGECGQLMPAISQSYQLKNKPPVKLDNKESISAANEKMKLQWKMKGQPVDNETKRFLIAMKEGGIAGFESVNITTPEEPFNPSCETLWKYVEGASKHVAKRRLTRESFDGSFQGPDNSQIPWPKVLEDVKTYLAKLVTGQVGADPVDRLSVQVLRNSLDRTTFGALSSQVFGRSPFNSSDFEENTGLLAKTEGHGGFFKIQYFANAVPYVQGLLLYLLSIAFPFFAIFLVIPSRATSFLAWMGMWAWVKSWDVGFAAVHIARDIMWEMMSRRQNVYSTDVDWTDPVNVISIMYSNDPFATQNTYWMVISTITLAIPFVTAHFFLGATGLFDMFSGTIDQTADRFGDTERSRSRRHVANINEMLQRNSQFNTALNFMKASMEQPSASTPEGRKELDKRQAAAAAAGLPNVNTGKGTMSGNPVHAAEFKGSDGRGMSASEVRHASAAFTQGMMLAGIGNAPFTQRLEEGRMKADKDNTKHVLRGTMPLHTLVAPEMKDDAGNPLLDSKGQKQYDMSKLHALYGDNEVSRGLAQRGATWSEVFHMSSQFQLDNQALTAAETGRRMLSATRSSNQAASLLNIQNQSDKVNRPAASALDVATVPFFGQLSETLGIYKNLDIDAPKDIDLQRPSTDSFGGATGAPIPKK